MSQAQAERSVKRTLKLERRATRILEIWADRPSMRSDEVLAQIRREFGCGIGAADQAMTRSRELYAELRQDPALFDRVVAAFWEGIEGAKRDKKWTAYFRGLDRLCVRLGIGAPEKIQITGSMAHVMAEMTTDELMAMQKAQRLMDDFARARAGSEALSDGLDTEH